MKRILMIPLDERPCNYRFPQIMPRADYELLLPPYEMMGRKKKPADTARLAAWVRRNASGADILILSMDTLIYGGLIPSRLHSETAETLCARADLIRELKEAHPALKIYAFQTIMRCPRFSNGDEEPEYYWTYGADIHRYGKYLHREQLGILTEEEAADFARIKGRVPVDVLADYTGRRDVNLGVLFHTLTLAEEGLIDGFIVPQDDSAPYGFTSLDQQKVRKFLKEHRLWLKVPVYPAADDTGMTMLARAVNESRGTMPAIYVYYASARGPFVVPSFEDRTIDATVKSQILAAGCRRVYSLEECDIVLAVNIGSEMYYEGTFEQLTAAYDVERSLPEYIAYIKYALEKGKLVAVADVAYPTHNDLELAELLRDEGLLLKIHGYAGWNTSSNTLGTVICETSLYLAGKDDEGNRYFLLHRYYDDVGYCSHSRTWIDVNVVEQNGCTVFLLDGERGKCTEAAREELLRYMAENYPELSDMVADVEVTSPWNRTFEMDFVLKLK